MNVNNKWQPFIYGLLIAAGLLAGFLLRPSGGGRSFMGGKDKFGEVLRIIDQAYVDTVNEEELETKALNELLSQLDPHSVYIPVKDLQLANEQLEGNFEGIGIEFNIYHDTIMVVAALNGGPSQQLGIEAGDRIVAVENKNVTNIHITNEQVFKLLRGPGGTEVKVNMYRPSIGKTVPFVITRGTIPIHSVDLGLMLDATTGYIKISRFAANTHEEFAKALDELKSQGMSRLILDLRGNPGGYLSAATQIADELLDDKKLIVYTEGQHQERKDYTAEARGGFEEGKLVVLIDEGSASASEILSGTVQDWDRGLIIGRRSFGKGLVQEPFELRDGSAIRLTVSRYYTPSGRCIQKTYQEGYHDYENEIANRFDSGELQDSVHVHISDSTIFYTAKGRKVYGGGGIAPDLFVPIDTSYSSGFLTKVISSGIITQFAIAYADRHRAELAKYKSAKDFDATFHAPLLGELVDAAKVAGIGAEQNDLRRSGSYLEVHAKALIARQLWRDEGYFRCVNGSDRILRKAMQVMGNYDQLLSKK